MRKKYFVPLLFLSLLFACQEKTRLDVTTKRNPHPLINEIDTLSIKIMEDFAVPGAVVALIEEGKLIKTFYYGYADKEEKLKPNSTTLFSLGSISKSLTAWGIMKLVEKRTVSLDTPIGAYIKNYSFPEHDYYESKITIRRLLSHSAGLSIPGYRGFDTVKEVPTTIASLQGATNGPGTLEVIYPPGEAARYSGGGYTVLQLIIEDVTGLTFSEYMQQEVFKPLGMNHTTFELMDDTMPLKELSAIPYEESGKRITDRHYAARAAAGLRSTHDDMIRFILAELGETKSGLLSKNAIEELHSIQPPSRYYGLGHQIRPMNDSINLIGHVGNNQGWLSNFQLIKESKAGLLILTNGNAGFYFQSAVACKWINFYTTTCTNEFCAVVPLAKFGKLKQLVDQWHAGNLIDETTMLALNDKIHQIRIVGSNDINKVLLDTQRLNEFIAGISPKIPGEQLEKYTTLYNSLLQELKLLVQQNCID